MIQAEYGWPDKDVLEIPICRIRQIRANIELRQKALRLHKTTIAEWQTRTLAQFIAATVPVEKGKKNPLMDEASKIQLRIEDDEGKADDETPMEVYIEEGSQVAQNAPGSYERLLGGFGN